MKKMATTAKMAVQNQSARMAFSRTCRILFQGEKGLLGMGGSLAVPGRGWGAGLPGLPGRPPQSGAMPLDRGVRLRTLSPLFMVTRPGPMSPYHDHHLCTLAPWSWLACKHADGKMFPKETICVYVRSINNIAVYTYGKCIYYRHQRLSNHGDPKSPDHRRLVIYCIPAEAMG